MIISVVRINVVDGIGILLYSFLNNQPRCTLKIKDVDHLTIRIKRYISIY